MVPHSGTPTPMSTTTIIPPKPEADSGAASPAGDRSRERIGRALPEPVVEKLRGPKLIVLWLALIAGAWAVAAGAVYGLYALVSPFLL